MRVALRFGEPPTLLLKASLGGKNNEAGKADFRLTFSATVLLTNSPVSGMYCVLASLSRVGNANPVFFLLS